MRQPLKAILSPDFPIAPCNYINQAVEIFKAMQNSFSYRHKNDQFVMLSNLFMLLSMHNISNTQYDDSYSPYTRIICNYVHENYANVINEAELAKVAHISINHLIRVFKADMNMTPCQYLMNYRIKKAQELLPAPQKALKTLCFRGFSISKKSWQTHHPSRIFYSSRCCVCQLFYHGIVMYSATLLLF